MQVLALNRRILLAFGLCIKDSNNPHYGRFINYGIFVILACFLMITTEYISSHFDDRTDAIYALMQFVSFLSAWACYPCFANQKCQTFKVLNNIQEIANDYHRENERYGIYGEAEKKSHSIAKWPTIFYLCAFYGAIVKAIISLIVFDLIPGEMHPETWYTEHKMSAPFDRETLFGFSMYLILEVFFVTCYYAGFFPCFSFFAGTYYYLEACCDELSERFNTIDELVLTGATEKDISPKLMAIMLFHEKIIDQFKNLKKIFSGVLFFQLACGSAFISTTLFQLDMAWGTFDSNFFVVVCVSVLSLLCILPYCLYPTLLSFRLFNISRDAYQCLWYMNATKLQKYFMWIIFYSQEPRTYDGYKIFTCSLESFTTIMKASGSYYLMLKSFK